MTVAHRHKMIYARAINQIEDYLEYSYTRSTTQEMRTRIMAIIDSAVLELQEENDDEREAVW